MSKLNAACDECGGLATPEDGALHNGDGTYLCEDCVVRAKDEGRWHPHPMYDKANGRDLMEMS